jgi:hypothetical protein
MNPHFVEHTSKNKNNIAALTLQKDTTWQKIEENRKDLDRQLRILMIEDKETPEST